MSPSDPAAPSGAASDNPASRKETDAALEPCPKCQALIEASGRSLADILLPTEALAPTPDDAAIGFRVQTLLEKARDSARVQRDGFGRALLTAINALRSYQHGNAAPDLAREIADHCESVVEGLRDGPGLHVLPAEMTPAILEVLGQMNFVVGPIAHAFQAAGEPIPKKYEAEQAHVLFRFLHLALQHGDGWRQKAGEQLKAAIDAAKAKKAGEVAP